MNDLLRLCSQGCWSKGSGRERRQSQVRVQPQANSCRDASMKSHSECWCVSLTSTLLARSRRAWLAASFLPSIPVSHGMRAPHKGAHSHAHPALCTSGLRGFGGPRESSKKEVRLWAVGSKSWTTEGYATVKWDLRAFGWSSLRTKDSQAWEGPRASGLPSRRPSNNRTLTAIPAFHSTVGLD